MSAHFHISSDTVAFFAIVRHGPPANNPTMLPDLPTREFVPVAMDC